MVFQIFCQLHMWENSKFRVIIQLQFLTKSLWHSAVMKGLPFPSPHGGLGRKFHMTWVTVLPFNEYSAQLLFDFWYKLTLVSDLSHPVHDESCWPLCGCGRWLCYYMAYHWCLSPLLEACEKLHFVVVACSLMWLFASWASVILSEACVCVHGHSIHSPDVCLFLPLSCPVLHSFCLSLWI